MSENTNFNAYISTKIKRTSMPSIDPDPAKQGVVMHRDREADKNLSTVETWGQRTKDHYSELMSVCQSKLLRSSFPQNGVGCITRIVALLEKSRIVVHARRTDIGPSLSFLLPREGELGCSQILFELDGLYKHCLGFLTDGGFLSADVIDDLGLLPSLMDVQQENRAMYQLSSSIESLAKAHAGAQEKPLRDISVLLGFLGQSLRTITPGRIKAPYNACVLCHRHDLDRVICSHHIENNRYISSSTQRKRYTQTLEMEEARLGAAAKNHESTLRSILAREAGSGVTAEDAMTAFNVLLDKPVEGLSDLRQIWTDAIDAGTTGLGFSMLAAAHAWYESEAVDDPKGIKRLEQPMGSLLLHVINDVSRFCCFVSSGGEMLRQRRKRVDSPEDMNKIAQLRQDGLTLKEISLQMEISSTQVRRILDDIEIP